MHSFDRCCRKPSADAVRYTVINTTSQDVNIKSDCTACGNCLSYVLRTLTDTLEVCLLHRQTAIKHFGRKEAVTTIQVF